MRKAQGCFAKEDCLLRVSLAPLLPEKVPGALLARADSRYQWGAAAPLSDNTLNPEPRHLLGMLPGLPGTCKGFPVRLCLRRGW